MTLSSFPSIQGPVNFITLWKGLTHRALTLPTFLKALSLLLFFILIPIRVFSQDAMETLFDLSAIPGKPSAPHTYVFFIHGAQDHWRPDSLDQPTHWGRADAKEVEEIKTLAKQCQSCNVLLLHIQRGGARWYTPNHSWATYLRGYRLGQKIFSRHVPLIPAASANTLSRLLIAASQLFPHSELHLIYRGHGFAQPYSPSQVGPERAPFDYNFPELPYSIETFATGLKGAHLDKKLASISFAACRMSDLTIANQLAPYADFLIASQVELIEDLSVSFRYSFLLNTPWRAPSEETTRLIAHHLLDAFETSPDRLETKMEFPISRVELKSIPLLQETLRQIVREIHFHTPDFFETYRGLIQTRFHLKRSLSHRQAMAYASAGKSSEQIKTLAKIYEKPSPDPKELDLIALLRWLSTQELAPSTQHLVTEALKLIESSIEVFHSSPLAEHFGMSLTRDELTPGS